MPTRFIVRLLDDANQLLAWAEVFASPAPQEGRASCPFWPTGSTPFQVEQAGTATKLVIHWPELDVARVTPILEATPVAPGQTVAFHWIEPIWLVSGMRDVPMPAVTVRAPVQAQPPPAEMGARDPRVN